MVSEKQHSGFTTMQNITVRNNRLSLRDKGLLLLLLSYPPNWGLSVAGLSKVSNHDGKDAIAASLKHLESEGYVKRERKRDKNGKLLGCTWMVSDVPMQQLNTTKPTTAEPMTDLPVQAQPVPAQPVPAQPAPVQPAVIKNVYNKDCIERKTVSNKDCVSVPRARRARERTPFVAPSVEEIESFCSQEQLSIDAQKFVDNYAAKGWTIGSTPVHDWKALVRKWAREDQERASEQPPQTNGLVEINGKQYLYKGGKYYVPGGCGVAVDPYAVDDLPF